jgi:hypothetical protein
MKLVLVGYPGSQFLVPVSKYLITKYMPGFDVVFLNYEGDVKRWSNFIKEYLETLNDDLVIFALDDYLINSPVDMEVYQDSLHRVKDDAVCINLHKISTEEHVEYPVTTQYTIWNRKFLIWLLNQTRDPWDFEMRGSRILTTSGQYSLHNLRVAVHYNTSSALSQRWHGVNLAGLKKADVQYINNNFNL